MSEIIAYKQAGEIGDALADVVASDAVKEKLKKPLQEMADMLRKKICEAHADLLKTERTLDLEDQVKSLVEQINKLEMRNRELSEELRDLRPLCGNV